MWSEELLIMDRNTESLMIDEMSEEIDILQKQLVAKDEQLETLRKQLEANQKLIKKLQAENGGSMKE